MGRYIAYCRVSGDAQSTDKQEDYHRTRAAELGLEPILIPETKSGATLDRKVRDLIENLKSGDILSFWFTSRWGRPNPEDIGQYLQWAKEANTKGATLEIDRNTVDVYSTDGVLKLTNALIAAYDERINILTRTTRGKKLKRAEGKFRAGGQAPYGFKKEFGVDPEKGVVRVFYVHVSEEVEKVMDLFQHVKDGKKIQDWCDNQNNTGELKLRKGRGKGKLGEWHKSTAQFLLFNPIYMGYTFHAAGMGERVKARRLIMSRLGDMSLFVPALFYKPVITPEQYWAAVTTYTNGRKRTYSGYEREKEDIYTRSVFCLHCHRMGKSVALYLNTVNGKLPYYRLNGSLEGCTSQKTIRAESFRAMVTLAIEFVFQEPSETKTYIASEIDKLRDANRDRTLLEIEQKIKLKELELAKWKNNLKKAPDPDILDAWLENIDKVNAEILRLKSQRTPLLADDRLAEIHAIERTFEKSTFQMFYTDDLIAKREAFRKLVRRVWINGRNLVFIFQNSKVIRFELPQQKPGMRPKQVFPFTVGFLGRMQLRGIYSPESELVKVAASKVVRSDLRDAHLVTYASVGSVTGRKMTLVLTKRNREFVDDL